MNDVPLVIVGVATCNNIHTIDHTIDMLIGQTRPPDRIIFCDNSSDGTHDKIQEYQGCDEAPPIEIIDQSGDGVADAYDHILDQAEGYDIFATIQTELQVDSEWLEGHIRLHDKYPDIDMVMGDHKTNVPTDKQVSPDERPYYSGRNFSAKSGALEGVDGWDSNFLRGEDWDMRIRLAGAGTKVYAKTDLGHKWQNNINDHYITLTKAKRKPTSITFMLKYGLWYASFHPSHVVSDMLSLISIVSVVGTGVFLTFAPTLATVSTIASTLSIAAYWIGHLILRGGVDGSIIIGPMRKQLLQGIAILYASNRMIFSEVEWNMSGFNPENIPRYKF
jgi:glycosyltransferase involved in cell wall biosynthesis